MGKQIGQSVNSATENIRPAPKFSSQADATNYSSPAAKILLARLAGQSEFYSIECFRSCIRRAWRELEKIKDYATYAPYTSV